MSAFPLQTVESLPARPLRLQALLWPTVFVAALVLVFLPAGTLPTWATKFPAAWQLPFAKWISTFAKWLMEDASLGFVTVREVTRGLAAVLNLPLVAAKALLADGIILGDGPTARMILPPIPWFSMLIAVTAVSAAIGGRRLAITVALGLLYLAVFGQWQSAMTTLASVFVASLLGAAAGLLLGLACIRWRAVERVTIPIIDIAQTMPVFAYLLPMLILFGFGPVSAMIATIAYALPPMVRVTILGIRAVPEQLPEMGRMAGCSRQQVTWKILVPAARAALMVGVNQVIMLSLNVVIIASMIGAGGLGWDVLAALRRLDIGAGLEAGLAITVLAILLDRIAQALGRRARPSEAQGALSSRRLVLAGIGVAAALWAVAALVPSIAPYPDSLKLSTAPFWSQLVTWINVTFFDNLEAFKNAILLNFLIPIKRFMLALPWPFVVAAVTFAGWRLGGWPLSLLVGLMALFPAVAGLWPATMTTVYLCGAAVFFSVLIGLPIGMAAAQRPRLWKGVEMVIDLLQTLPSFVYLIPIVMLFRVGDFTALIAIVLYAVAPAIRYTRHGIAGVSPALIEAGQMSGCTRPQIMSRIRVPLAMPDMLLGLNQTILLALSMLVITALVGTRDLGQETYMALSKADVGKGIVAGLCVAFIGMIADRLISAGVERMRRRAKTA